MTVDKKKITFSEKWSVFSSHPITHEVIMRDVPEWPSLHVHNNRLQAHYWQVKKATQGRNILGGPIQDLN